MTSQSGPYVAMVRGMEAFDPAPLHQAAALAREVYQRVRARYGDRVYQAAAGVAMAAADHAELVFERAGSRTTPPVAEQAQQHIMEGRPEAMMDVMYPVPLLLTAETFMQKYGPEETAVGMLNGSHM